MFRNALAGAALMLAPMAALAQGADQFQGFYGGVQLGYFEPALNGTDLGDGISGALVGGYNHALGPNALIGAEVMLGTPLTFSPGIGAQYVLEDMIQLRARGGVVTGDVLWYGAVGYQDDSLSANGGALSLNADGWTYAVGAEWMFAQDWSARIEYQGYDLNVEGGNMLDMNSIQVGVLFHF